MTSSNQKPCLVGQSEALWPLRPQTKQAPPKLPPPPPKLPLPLHAEREDGGREKPLSCAKAAARAFTPCCSINLFAVGMKY
ncbi:hypothetical protein Leryth_004270 [Lithospermum erythrorhizon]|nr:hypothetical protein Leryth_004270 [Lithospermum erythrorhizon]